MKSALIAYGLLGVAAVLGIAEWHGHHRGYAAGVADTRADADKQIGDAHTERDRYLGERNVANRALVEVKQSLQTQRNQLNALRDMARAALDARDTMQQQLDVLTAKHKADLTKAAHDDPQCADLARLPVCPTVARRLWGNPQGNQGAAGH
ncbi:hypothetical protein KR767_04145 [Luteibacter anthropi]|uniref:hypothetical protein n=1 Tax=Luteibacter anthropi TaxID=564369 RepID=UPI0020322C31|nr:hypothetical protein [Luteibacter anthropi]URX63268.1 hypothetical protein KR767_04145 [Luteibacter anthropi]